MAKNSLSNIHGFSSYQLLYGRNPNLPSVLSDDIPALEGTTSSIPVADHISSLYAARRAFTQSESAERVRRAIRKQVRQITDVYEAGNKVFYKRPDSLEWRGPGCVIGRDGSVVFVRHGGKLVRVHVSRLRKRTHPEVVPTEKDNQIDERRLGTSEQESERPVHEQMTELTSEPVIEEDENTAVERSDENELQLGDRETRELSTSIKNLKTRDIVKYKHKDSEETVLAQLLSRAGKANGKNKHWFNVKILEPEDMKGAEISVDLSQVSELEQVPDVNTNTIEQEDTILTVEDVSWTDAKGKELNSWRENRVYEEVENNGQKCISVRWVCTLKESDGGITKKARLVARGFEENSDDIKCDFPTCAQESMKMVIAVMSMHNWTPNSLDIKTAFLQGGEIGRDVYIKPPKEAGCDGKLWKLQKCVYGLCDASLKWYQQVKSVLETLGGRVSKVDPTVFFWKENEMLLGVIACHVDDFLWGGDKSFEKVIKSVRERLTVGKEEEPPFRYIGLQLSEHEEGISLNQNHYVKNIEPIQIDKSKAQEKQTVLTQDEKGILRSKIGQIMWAARQTRPDILFSVCELSAKVNNSKVENILELNKCVKQLKSDKVTLQYPHLGGNSVELLIYTDSSLGNLEDGGSQGGSVIFLRDKQSNKVAPIMWSSKKIRRVARSTLAAETMAMADGIDRGMLLSYLYGELMGKEPHVRCVTDCKSLHDALFATSNKCTEKRLRMDIASIKEKLESPNFTVVWMQTTHQLADVLTKKGASPLRLLDALERGLIDT